MDRKSEFISELIFDMKSLSKSKGYLKLKHAVIKDCMEGQKCFNTTGCNQQFHRYENGHCYVNTKCFHKYCDKFKFIINFAQHCAYVFDMSVGKVLDIWESDRNYNWYMNYYQPYSYQKSILKKLLTDSSSE